MDTPGPLWLARYAALQSGDDIYSSRGLRFEPHTDRKLAAAQAIEQKTGLTPRLLGSHKWDQFYLVGWGSGGWTNSGTAAIA